MAYVQSRHTVRLAFVVALVGAMSLPSPAQTRGAGDAKTGERRALSAGEDGFTARAYRIGPGDTIDVTFRYTPEFNDEVVVGPDGRVEFKATGALKVAGLTVEQTKQAIVEASAAKLVRPEVAVTLKDFDRPHVFIAGEVNTPGRQDLRHPTTVLQAILMSGGPKDDAALGRVLLFRRIDADTAEVHVLQLAHFGRKAREENDVLLEPNDMILVRRDVPSHIERFIKLANLGLYLNPLQNASFF